MGNKRLYEVAKELGKSANEVIEVLKKCNMNLLDLKMNLV